MTGASPRVGAVLGATGRAAMDTARFLFLAFGALVFLLVLLLAWWIMRHVPSVNRGDPAFSWSAEPLASVTAQPLLANHPSRGREEGWLFGGPGTGKVFAAMILAERNDSGYPFGPNSPIFWQLGPLRSLRPAIGGPYYEMTTRWGRFTGRDLTYREDDGRIRTCVVFRNGFETSEFALGGFYCAPGQQAADATSLACMIDRLQLRKSERPTPGLIYLAARAGNGSLCSNSTFYPPGSRNPVRDRRGGVVRLRDS